jgi:ATP-binding cassette subfamily F protein uup
LLVFESGKFVRHEGGWADYLERRKAVAEQVTVRRGGAVASPVVAPAKPRRGLTYAERLELDGLLERVDEAEQKVSALEAELAGGGFYERPVAAQQAFFARLEQARGEAAQLAERWAELEGRR